MITVIFLLVLIVVFINGMAESCKALTVREELLAITETKKSHGITNYRRLQTIASIQGINPVGKTRETLMSLI